MFASEGRICDACHASRARAEAMRNISAHHIHEGRLGAVFACVAAVGVFFVAAASRSLGWIPVRMLGPTLFAVAYAVYNAIVMVRRTRFPGVRGWPLPVSIGAAVVASLSFVAFGLWCMNPLEVAPP